MIVNIVSKALQFHLCFSRDSSYHREGKRRVVSGLAMQRSQASRFCAAAVLGSEDRTQNGEICFAGQEAESSCLYTPLHKSLT